MSKARRCLPCDALQTKSTFSRRDFVRSGALVAAGFTASSDVFALAQGRPSVNEASPIQLGVASYTFRNFKRAQMIGFLKQLNVLALNAKDVKDHLPTDTQEEAGALADYAAAGIPLPPAGTISFPKGEMSEFRKKFPSSKRAGNAALFCRHRARQTIPRTYTYGRERRI